MNDVHENGGGKESPQGSYLEKGLGGKVKKRKKRDCV